MKTKKTSRKALAIILSIIMVVLTLNVSTVSAYSNELKNNIQITDTAQVNIVDGNGNEVEQTTTQAQTQDLTHQTTEKQTETPTEETQPTTEKATVEVNKNSNDPTLNIATGSIRLRSSDSSLQYQQGSGEWITYTGEFTIEGTTSTDAKGNTIVEATTNTVTVESGAHNITLSNVNIDLLKAYSIIAFNILGTSSVILTLAEGTTNTLKSGYYRAGVQVQTINNETASVEIKGKGTLVAESPGYGAGIGGGNGFSAGTIAINGNTKVTAIGGDSGAGIGGGSKGDGGTITISDNATVTATTGENGAGIGGGYESAGGIITISDNAKVTATSTEAGAGIGGGGYTGNAGTITIKDSAEVTAIGGDEGAGIGLGLIANEGTIIIRDTATVTAIGGPSGAGIGGSNYAKGGTITISHAAKVTAIGGKAKNSDYTYPSAIGSGSNSITGGKQDGATLKIGSGATVIAVPQGDGIAIDNKGAITAPDGEELANILQLNYETELLTGTETALYNQDNQDIKEFSYTPDVNYKAMVFTGVDETTTYNVVLTQDANIETMQQGINENNSDSEYTVDFIANDNDKFTNYIQIKKSDIQYKPIKNINENSIKFRTDSILGTQYSVGEVTDESTREWATYKGEFTIEGIPSTDAEGNATVEETTNTVTVESGTHNITLSNVNINVSKTSNRIAFDIQGTSSVILTLEEGTTNTLKSGYYKAGLQVQTIDNETGSVDIQGSGTLITNGGGNGAGIGGGYRIAGGIITINGNAKVVATGGALASGIGGGESGDGGIITISGNADVIATGSYYAAGIGGGESGDGGTITISGNANVTATVSLYGPGIGGGSNGAAGTITISDNANVTATGGEFGSGIGSGRNGTGGTITISNNANVIATGGASGAGIGSGSGDTTGSTIAISYTAKVTAVSDGINQAIDAINNEISAPENEDVANILELNYQNSIVANSQTALFDGTTIVASYTPSVTYQSIAFSGLDMNKTYTAELNKIAQQGQKGELLTSDYNLTQGLNIYTNVQSTTDKLKTVTFENTDGDVLAEEYVVTGGTATRPVLPQLRTEEYVQDFEDSALENITTDTTLVYKKVPKIVEVTASIDYIDKLDITVDNAPVDTEVVYGKIVKSTYTGEGSVIGWKINDHVVSVTDSNTYAFYVVETSIIEPILEGTAIEVVDINVGIASYSTEDNNTTKAYYPIVAAGYQDATEVKYGVIRSTVESDVTEENIRQYLDDTTQQTNSNIVREYTDTNVMNGDGRYNYVAVMPTDTDKTLYVKAWIEVDGVLYVS